MHSKKKHSPIHDAWVAVIVRNSFRLGSFRMPVRAGSRMIGNELHKPISNSSIFSTVVAANWWSMESGQKTIQINLFKGRYAWIVCNLLTIKPICYFFHSKILFFSLTSRNTQNNLVLTKKASISTKWIEIVQFLRKYWENYWF